MKNLVLVLVIAFAFSTTAMAVDIAISTQANWWSQEAADREMQEIVDNVTTVSVERFAADQQVELADWVVAHTGDGESDLLILCGQFPDTIYEPGNTQVDDSLAELFLDDGNTIINTGDYLFYVVNGAGTNGTGGLETMMDIVGISMWDDDTPAVVTADGQDITPSLVDFATDRPFHLNELEGDWYAELVLAQNDAGTRADAVIVANAATGGRLGIFYQTASQDDDPRGEVMSEWINNWYLAGNLDVVERAVLFTEDFEGLALGPNVDEALAGDAVWTDTPPEGWVVDESGIPGIGMDETDGVTEWAGWAFADKAWWTETAGDQDRSLFELGSGIVAVADPDEWDDGERMPIPIAVDPYDTWLTTPEIAISGSEVGTLQLKFDSSWRPEFDDNYHQTANITASFDGGEPVVVMLWESDEASDNYKPYATNETVIVNLDNPAGARRLVLTFGLFDAGNDWWWAIDNLEVSGIVQGLEPVDPGTDGLAAFYALAGDATDSSGNGIDGTIGNAETGGLGDGGSVWVDDPERGTVISFNGTAAGAYVRAGDIPQMTLTNDFTWAFWANHSDENTADNDIILGNRMDENTVDFVPRQFIKFTPTKFEWHMNGNGDDNMDYDDIPADVWLHHAVVKTGDQLTYYRNGVEGGSGTITQPLDFPQPLYFGGDNEGSDGENWSGLMSEVAIYDRALSVGEVRYLAGEREGDPSLVIYYDFDEVGDIVADQSGKGHDGVVNGDVTAEAEGKLGGAANFANGGFLDLDGPSIPAEDIPTSAMTLAAWIKIANTGGDHEIFSARASDESWLIHPEPKSSGDIRWLLRSYGGTTIFQIRAGTVTWDEWLHFAGTYDKESGKAALYINGELIEEMVVENPADIAGDWGLGARVGKTIDDGRPFTGLMDEFRMYTRALSQDEVLTIMQGM